MTLPNALPEPTAPQDGEQPDLIDTLRELEAKASPAPWRWEEIPLESDEEDTGRHFATLNDDDGVGILVHDAFWPIPSADAELIAAMRNALPDLLSRLSSLSTELVRVRGALDKIADRYEWAKKNWAPNEFTLLAWLVADQLPAALTPSTGAPTDHG